MGQEKIGAFYSDPDKCACDSQLTGKVNFTYSFSTDRRLSWRFRRLITRFRARGRGAVEFAQETIRSLPSRLKEAVPQRS